MTEVRQQDAGRGTRNQFFFSFLFFQSQLTFNIISHLPRVDRIEVRDLDNTQSDAPNKSSAHLTPCILITAFELYALNR